LNRDCQLRIEFAVLLGIALVSLAPAARVVWRALAGWF
jgi:hypothetical protein